LCTCTFKQPAGVIAFGDYGHPPFPAVQRDTSSLRRHYIFLTLPFPFLTLSPLPLLSLLFLSLSLSSPPHHSSYISIPLYISHRLAASMFLTRPSHTRRSMPPIHYTLLVLLSLWTRIITAELACISPTSTPSEIHPGRPIALGSLDGASVSTLSDITAHLVCSSTRTVALRLGGGYDATDFSPHSPSVTITTAQAATALSSCPSNVKNPFPLPSSLSSLCLFFFSEMVPQPSSLLGNRH